MNLQHAVQDVRDSLGAIPRSFGLRDRLRNPLRRPHWVDRRGFHDGVLMRQKELYASGEVVWAFILMANKMLRKRGTEDSAARVLYSHDRRIDSDYLLYERIARRLVDLKQSGAGSDLLQQAVRAVFDELNHTHLTIPSRICEGHEVFGSSIIVRRRHLPNGTLDAALAPVLALRDVPAAIIVPHWYWPVDLLDLWRDNRS